MKLESLIDSALREGAGISLKKVEKSAKFKERLQRKLELPETYSAKTHRGRALREGTPIFGTLLNINLHSQGEVFELLKGSTEAYSRERLRDEALIEELGERLIETAVKRLSPSALEIAAEFRKAKDATTQIALLRKLDALIDQVYDENKVHGEEDDAEVVPGYDWLDDYFKQRLPSEFLPHQFSQLGKGKLPNCLGVSILLAAWATAAGARFLFASEIANYQSEEYRFLIATYKAMLGLLDGLSGREVREFRKELKDDLRNIKGWQKDVRDWHHSIAVELKDGRWFLLDPYANLDQVFPDQWQLGDVAKILRKYEEVLPGLSLVANDHGVQRENLEVALDELLKYVTKAEAAKYKLEADPGNDCAMEDYLEIAPELEVYTNLLVENHPRWPRPSLAPSHMLGWSLFAWERRDHKFVKLTKEEACQDKERFGKEAKFRRKKLNGLLAEFARQAQDRVKNSRGIQIHPAIEFGNPAFSIGLFVLSNLSSWTEAKVPGTLLLRYGNSQLLWHEAVSPVPKFSSLSELDKTLVRMGYYAARWVPHHPRTKLKFRAVRGLINKINREHKQLEEQKEKINGGNQGLKGPQDQKSRRRGQNAQRNPLDAP